MNIQDKNLYYIGGVVRDEILGLKSFDIDLTYDGDAIEFAKTIPNAEIVQINEPFGTVRIRLKNSTHPIPPSKGRGIEIDIASTRSESYPQKGHLPVVDKIGCSLKDDVLRRDFTINAMAKSTINGEIIDYTSGLEDIKNKKLRVLHNGSFIDDPTRILRALKFAVRFGFELDKHTEKLQKEYLENINYDMSYKRLKKELIETFNLNNWNAFERFINQGIYKLIAPQEYELPEYNFSGLINNYILATHPTLFSNGQGKFSVWIIYVGLLPDISNLPLTKVEKNIVEKFRDLAIYKPHLPLPNENTDFEIYKIFKNIPIESVIMYSAINPQIVEHYLNDLKDIELEITGEDLKSFGINPSAKYQECFDFVLQEKIKNPKITKENEIKLAKEFFQTAK